MSIYRNVIISICQAVEHFSSLRHSFTSLSKIHVRHQELNSLRLCYFHRGISLWYQTPCSPVDNNIGSGGKQTKQRKANKIQNILGFWKLNKAVEWHRGIETWRKWLVLSVFETLPWGQSQLCQWKRVAETLLENPTCFWLVKPEEGTWGNQGHQRVQGNPWKKRTDDQSCCHHK